MKKLRLLLLEECNRTCEGCCNKDWDINKLETENSFDQYSLIMITGGEPLLVPVTLMLAISDIRDQTDAPIYIYTAMVKDSEYLKTVLRYVEGITLTLHEQKDAEAFQELNSTMSESERAKSLRLNVFSNVDMTGVDTTGWTVKSGIEWIKDCPLPDDEVFKRY